MSSKSTNDPPPSDEPLRNSYVTGLKEEYDVYRWANWLKFLSLFFMIETISSVIMETLTEVIPSKTRKGIPLYQVYLLSFASFAMSYFGYIVSISKSSKITLNYLVAYFIYIIFQSILYFSYARALVKDLCEEKEEEGEDCDQSAVFIIGYILLWMIWIVMISITFKLFKYTKHLEKMLVDEANSELNDIDMSVGILMRKLDRRD